MEIPAECSWAKSKQANKLIETTYESMCEGSAGPGNKLGDIGYAIQKHAEGNYFSVVKEYWVMV